METGRYKQSLSGRKAYTQDGALFAHKTMIIGPMEPSPTAPNAFLVEQEPNTELPVHFHGYGQFQVVLKGKGQLGNHELQAPMVHYAGQRTPYGPIRVGAEALVYLTLRPATEGAAFYMPASRHLRDPAIPRFDRFGSAGDTLANTSTTVTLIPEDLPGLGAWLVRIPPGQSARAPELGNGYGRFHVLLEGAWKRSETLEPWDIVWTDPTEAPLDFHAGPEGLLVMIVQFPANACAFPHPAPDRPQNTRIGG